jgi:hypothetical protein
MKLLYRVLICLLFSLETAYGQDIIAGQFGVPSVNFLSPQTYEFVKYGNLPVTHFNGEADVSIPVYTYSDQDFKLPIYLGYNASGFIPAKREGIAGLNWYINHGGGVITRKVNGWPDERTGMPTTIPTELHGYYYGIKNGIVTAKTKTELFEFTAGGVVTPSLYWNIGGCEMEPDDFVFNIPGYSGKFFIENTGKVKTSGNKPFKVDLSNFAIQPSGTTTEVNPSTIVVTTDDGYTYTFGGSIQYLEVSFPIDANDRVGNGYPVIEAWHLSEIKAPNGRTVTFEYEEFVEGGLESHHAPADTKHYLLNTFDLAYSDISQLFLGFQAGLAVYRERTSSTSNGTVTIKNLTKTVYLKTITIGNSSIAFQYGEKERGFYGSELFSLKTLQLNTIQVKYGTEIIKQFDFVYQYYGGTGMNGRQFLTSFKEVGVGTGYQFYYHKVDPNFPDPVTLPGPKTHAVDHWGYWNGKTDNQVLLPDVEYEPNGDARYLTSERDPDPSKCDVALLYRIVYPTGGYTEFQYEPHAYTKRLERRNSSNFLPAIFNETGIAGGARIKEIKDYDGDKLINKREFAYVNDYATGGTQSSGVLLHWPRYLVYWKYQDNADPNHITTQHILKRKSATFNANYAPGEHFIHYGQVTEIFSPNNGFTTYKFHDYLTRPNHAQYLTSVVEQATQDFITNLHCYNNFVGIKYNDRSFERGIPYDVTTYALKTGGNYPVKKVVTDYATNTDYPNDYIVGIHQTGGLAQSYRLYHYPPAPKTITETLYSEEGTRSGSNVTTLTYNKAGFPLTKTIVLSDGSTDKTKIRYPLDFVTDADDPLLFNASTPTALYLSLSPEIKALVDLKKNNILNKPIEIVNFRNNVVLRASYAEYKDFASLNFSTKVYPAKLWVARIGTPTASFTEASIDKSGASWSFIKSPTYTVDPPGYDGNVTFDRYDDDGNLLQVTDKDLVKKSYQWGYNKQYPIAEIAGTTYDQFFYTGFEDAEGTTGASKAGRKSRPGGYSRSFAGLSPGTYLLTYWQKQTDNSWIPVRQELDVSSDPYQLSIPGTIHLDELRFYPKSCIHLLTYTYDPLIGMTSKNDFNNRIEYYEYDATGRQTLIRDDSRNILKKFEYNYKLH